EIKAHRRKGSRVLVIIVSNGNGGEEKWRNVQEIGNSVLSCGHAASGVNNIESDVAILHVDSLVKFRSESRRCAYDQMDLVIILDASTSRREEIRSAIESIEYRGGSTLTAQAVDLSVDDLLRGRRKDALQVVVLMNDGISQDTWDRVLSASERLASTKSERFGVALGSEIEAINTVYTQPSYAEAIALGVAKIHNEGRANARSALVILGNGNSKDSEALMIATAARIRETPSVTSFAVDASLSTNVTALEMFTGSSNHVYPYEKTAAFAKEINRLASSSENGICRSLQREVRGRLHAAAGVEVRFFFFSTPGPLKAETSLQRDALVEPLNVDKINEGKNDTRAYDTIFQNVFLKKNYG
ncbi:hypothetical protein GCK32_009850, partial [Trichostrongylus colubriformis]